VSRAIGLPLTIARLNVWFGAGGGHFTNLFDDVVAGRPVVTRDGLCIYSPAHEDDIHPQVEPLLDAASIGGTTVNWSGDDAVELTEAAAFIADLTGMPLRIQTGSVSDTLSGVAVDPTRRRSITGPSTVAWREGLRRVHALKGRK
jgi:nucleoside-diphosphate-sugar epimerase